MDDRRKLRHAALYLPLACSSPWRICRHHSFSLQTLAGPLTSRTMSNGLVLMSLMLVVSGNDLLGELDPEDSEPPVVRSPGLSRLYAPAPMGNHTTMHLAKS